MLTSSQIREIARRQRLRGVGMVAVKAGDDLVRIRVAGADLPSAADGRARQAATPDAATPGITVRSQYLGHVALADADSMAGALRAGDTVGKGQVMARIVLGESAYDVLAPASGTLNAVLVEPGQRVDYGMGLFEMTATKGASK